MAKNKTDKDLEKEYKRLKEENTLYKEALEILNSILEDKNQKITKEEIEMKLKEKGFN